MTLHRAACLLHSIYCGGRWYCWLALLPRESLPEDPKRKAHRKLESEEKARWRRSSNHRKERAALFPLLRGCGETLSLTGGIGVCYVLQPVYLSLHMGAFLYFLVVVVCLVLVCCSCNLARPFRIIILALYHSQSLSFLHSVVKATEFPEHETNRYIYIQNFFFLSKHFTFSSVLLFVP